MRPDLRGRQCRPRRAGRPRFWTRPCSCSSHGPGHGRSRSSAGAESAVDPRSALPRKRRYRSALRDLAVAPRHHVGADVRERLDQIGAGERHERGGPLSRATRNEILERFRESPRSGSHRGRNVHADQNAVGSLDRLGRGGIRRRVAALIEQHLARAGHPIEQARGEGTVGPEPRRGSVADMQRRARCVRAQGNQPLVVPNQRHRSGSRGVRKGQMGP
jgi:hypothetical protein